MTGGHHNAEEIAQDSRREASRSVSAETLDTIGNIARLHAQEILSDEEFSKAKITLLK